MSRSKEELALELLSLPASHRAELALRLIRSLDEVEESEAEALWIEVAERRLEEIESGKVQPIPADEALREIRARHRQDRI